MNEEHSLPLLADGSIVEDYRPLLLYWRKAADRDRKLAEEAILKREDFDTLKRMVEEAKHRSLLSLMESLKQRFIERIDPEIATSVFRELYGVEIDPLDARERIALILAGWLIEAGRRLKIIKYRSWRDR